MFVSDIFVSDILHDLNIKGVWQSLILTDAQPPPKKKEARHTSWKQSIAFSISDSIIRVNKQKWQSTVMAFEYPNTFTIKNNRNSNASFTLPVWILSMINNQSRCYMFCVYKF